MQESTMSLTKAIQDVEQFHVDVLGMTLPTTPTLVNGDWCMGRFKHLVEEADEFIDAAAIGDMVGVADALADTIYVAIGTAVQCGIPLSAVWDAVHRCNMRRVAQRTERHMVDAVKPPGWVGPEAQIARILGIALEQ
jgi:predicted HAD superfamily Cof-like phosphohydrolase